MSLVTAAHGEGPKFCRRVSPQPGTPDGFEKTVGVCRGGSGISPNPAETKNRGTRLRKPWGPDTSQRKQPKPRFPSRAPWTRAEPLGPLSKRVWAQGAASATIHQQA